MNDWVLALTSLTALAALTTVILAARSVSSGERAARAGERAVEQARLESKNRHYQEMIFQVQQLHIFKNSGYTIGHPDWYIPRNRLQVLTIGIDEDIPQTNEILMCSMPRAAPTEESQLELEEVIERIQRALYAEGSAEEWQKDEADRDGVSWFARFRPWSQRRAAGI